MVILIQWPFQPKLEVPTIYKVYVRGYAPPNMALYGTVPPFEDPEFPIDSWRYDRI